MPQAAQTKGRASPAAAQGSTKKAPKSVKDLNGRQKAAIFLISLGSELSSEIFKHLREDEIETLTFEIARTDNVEPELKEAVLMEFQELMMASEFIKIGRASCRERV